MSDSTHAVIFNTDWESAKKEIAKMEDHVFRVYDSNNDGFIDFVEFMVSMIFNDDWDQVELMIVIKVI